MDLLNLLKSAVLAACISGVVALIVAWVSAATAKRINRDKMELDAKLAREKAQAELALAERRVALDHQLAISKRKAEVAEKVLADFYEVRRAFDVIRSPMIWANEMEPEEGVAQDVVQNSGYGVIRRIRQHTELFSKLEATRFTFGALFGPEATRPYDALIRIHNQVFHAAEDLLRYRQEHHQEHLRDHLKHMGRVAFAGVTYGDNMEELPDPIAETLAQTIRDVEATCRPALESPLAAEAIGRDG